MEKRAKGTGVIIVDMQNEFCLDWNGKIKDCYAPIIDQINKVTEFSRRSGLKVFWLNWGVSKDLEDMSPFQKKKFNDFEYPSTLKWKKELNGSKKLLEKDSWSAKIILDLKTENQDFYIDKQRISGFWYSNLDRTLKENDIERLFFCGVNTDQCVLTTLHDAHFIGYECYLLSDCTATSSPSFCYDASLYNVKNCFGDVLSSSDLLK